MGAGRSRTGVAGGKSTPSNKGSAGGAGGGGSSPALDDYGVTDSDIMKKTFGDGWESLSFDEILEKKGFSALPKVVEGKEFNSLVKNGATELSRGITFSSKEQAGFYLHEMLRGDFYTEGGEAYFGRGMYSYGGDSLNSSSRYGMPIQMALKKGARIKNIDLEDHAKTYPKDLEPYKGLLAVTNSGNNKESFLKSRGITLPKPPTLEEAEAISKVSRAKGLGDVGTAWLLNQEQVYNHKISTLVEAQVRKELGEKKFKELHKLDTLGYTRRNETYAAAGYDAIRLTPKYVNDRSNNGHEEIVIVLNRGALVVNKTPLEKRFGGKKKFDSLMSQGSVYATRNKAERIRQRNLAEESITSGLREYHSPKKQSEVSKTSKTSSIVSKYKDAYLDMGFRSFAEYVKSQGDNLLTVLGEMRKWEESQ